MANIYVRSTDGSDADNGSTWALAKATLGGAAAIAVAGDNVYVSQAHAETNSSNLTLTWAGTLTNPVKVFCVNDAAEPPTALATTALITKTAGAAVTINGCVYWYGVGFNSLMNFNTINTSGRSSQVFESCLMYLVNTAGLPSATDAAFIWFKNCTFRFGNTSPAFNIGHKFRISGGSVVSGGTTPTNLLLTAQSARGGLIEIEGLDLSTLTNTFNFAQANALTWAGKTVFRNCKLPTGWSGSLINGTIAGYGASVEMHNCDAADTNYRFRVQDYTGQIDSETTIYRTGGASDGTTPISWRLAAGANVVFPTVVLESPELPAVWNTAVGSSKTATVEIVHDGATALNDGEVWLEVQYLSAIGFPLASFVSDRKVPLAAGTAQTTSAAAWTGDTGTGPNGSATWNTLKLECTFTPQEAGYIQARVYLAKPSTTVFVDPKITVV
jgi:hypothetical protein